MKIAIHSKEEGFSRRWISYCRKNNIDIKLVDCYSNDIIKQIEDCDVLMWHYSQSNYKDNIVAKQILFAAQAMGKRVFPDFNTSWHFDDKIGQKYLLESIDAPLVPTYVFYSKKDAKIWASNTNFPKVFKLRGGAGSENVKLVKNKLHAYKLIDQAFSRGFASFNKLENLKERIRKYKYDKGSLFSIIKGIVRFVVPIYSRSMLPVQKGYAYFQDYIPDNNYDIRVIVIGDRAFAIKRIVRDHDFRASGSGKILYEKENIPPVTVELSFTLSAKLKSQCTAFDFIFDIDGCPKVIEVSYGFNQFGYDKCVGYWDRSMRFYEGTFSPQDWMVELVISAQ